MRFSAFFIALLVSAVTIVGCKGETPNVGGTPAAKMYMGAVSLSPSTSELISSKTNGVTLLGRTAQCNWPSTNTKVPIVMKGVKPNYEEITQLKPPIVVYDDGLFSPDDIDKFKELGIETFAITGKTVEEFTKCLYVFGRKFHSETMCSEYVDTIHSAVSAAKGSPPPKTLKVAVLMPGNGGEHMIAGTDSFVADIVRQSQGEIVGPKADRFVAASAESLVSLNPDVILTAGMGTSIEKDPRLQSINAVKRKKIIPIDPDILLRRGARVNNLIRGVYNILSEAASS